MTSSEAIDLDLPQLVRIPAGLARIGTTMHGVEACVQEWGNRLVDPSYDVERFRQWILKEYPQHEVRIEAFSIGRVPVTNRQYSHFISHGNGQRQRTRTRTPESLSSGEPGDHPVWGVSQDEARAYAAWLSEVTGLRYRLPSEYEWEYAARGPSGREYPFGETFDQASCNTLEAGIGRSTPVDRYADFASEFGVVDTAGNVEEWTSTQYAPYPGGTMIHDDISRGPLGSNYPILRGGSFARGGDLARCARRHGPNLAAPFRFTGFRVASDSNQPRGSFTR